MGDQAEQVGFTPNAAAALVFGPSVRNVDSALDALAVAVGSAGKTSTFVFDPSQPGATGPVVFGTFGGAVDAANALASGGAHPVTTIFCKLGGLTVIPAVRSYNLQNIRLVGDFGHGTSLSEIRFPDGSAWLAPPMSVEALAISSASVGLALYTLSANEARVVELLNALFGRSGDFPIFAMPNIGSSLAVNALGGSLLAAVCRISEGVIIARLVDSDLGADAFSTGGGGTQALIVFADSISILASQTGWLTGSLNYALSPTNVGTFLAGPVVQAVGAYSDSGATPLNVLTGPTATIAISAQVNNPNGAPANANLAVDISGATTVAASDATGTNATNQPLSNTALSIVRQFTGLTVGVNTFKAFLQAQAQTESFTNISLVYMGP